MDYENDTDFLWPNGSSLVTITSKDDTRREPNPFSECVAADMQTALRRTPSLSSTATVTNPLDEHQQQIVDREEVVKRRSKTKARLQAPRQYVFKLWWSDRKVWSWSIQDVMLIQKFRSLIGPKDERDGWTSEQRYAEHEGMRFESVSGVDHT